MEDGRVLWADFFSSCSQGVWQSFLLLLLWQFWQERFWLCLLSYSSSYLGLCWIVVCFLSNLLMFWLPEELVYFCGRLGVSFALWLSAIPFDETWRVFVSCSAGLKLIRRFPDCCLGCGSCWIGCWVVNMTLPLASGPKEAAAVVLMSRKVPLTLFFLSSL